MLYGFDVKELSERLYILYIFQLAFSSGIRRREVYQHILGWDQWIESFSLSIDSIDWRRFQQDYRDYIDVAKMLQLVPVIGAAVGAISNYRLLDKLGFTAMNCYRMRLCKLSESR